MLRLLYRLALRLLPVRFRRRHGREMARVFGERCRDARRRGGRLAVIRTGAAALLDVVRTASAEHWERWREGRQQDVGHTYGKGGDGMGGWMRDLRYGARTLRRAPGFALVTVLTVALAIGANTAVFSVVQGVLLRDLPYDDPDRIVLVWGEMRNRGVNHFPSSPPDLWDYREMATSFQALAGVFTFAQPLTGDGEPQQVQVAGVTEGFLQALGVRPALGRDFVASEFDPAGQGVQPGDPDFANTAVLLSHHLWEQRWGGDPAVVGQVVDVGGTPSEIVGVLPEDFRFLMPPTASLVDRPDLFSAARIDPEQANRNSVFLRLVGRLAPGVSLEQAGAEMDRIAADQRDLYPIKASSDHHLHVGLLDRQLTAHVRPVMFALTGAVLLVLLVACANVSNLLLVRATGRGRELAVRTALGSGRGRLVRQMLVESLVLAGIGGVLGVGLAVVGIDLLLGLQPGNVPRLEDVGVDLPVLVFTAGAVVVTALLAGVLPALYGSRTDVASSLKDRGPVATGPAGQRLRSGMVVAEVALSLVLLVGAGLLVRSFVALQRVDPGFEPAGLVTFTVNLPFGRYPQAVDRHRVTTLLRERLEAIPGAESVTSAFPLPLDGQLANVRWGPEEALENPDAYQQADVHFVLPGYFETMGTRVLAGRTFTRAEQEDSADVVVLDEIMARRAFPDRDPVGQLFLVRAIGPEAEWREVIGVVEHQRHGDLAREGRGSVFFTNRYAGNFGGTWAIRTSLDPLSLAPAIREALAEVDPLLPVAGIEPLTEAVERATAPTRFALSLMGVFAGLAGVLAAVGLYGVLAHLVRQRRAEIGVRIAFGAPRATILGLVAVRGMMLAVLGVGLGLLVAWPLARVMETLLVDVQPRDPLTFGMVPLLFLSVAAAASVVPAWRASRIHPSEALRID